MRKNVLKLMMSTLAAASLMASTAFAAGWTLGQGDNQSRWWYDLGNGQYYGSQDQAVEWQWLDGNNDGTAECYAFDSQGWMYADATTPDGYEVNGDGAWTVNGAVQTMAVAAGYAGTRGQTAEQPESDSRILVAYFSKTGNTREAAVQIQAAAGGDLFEITVADPYPDSYQETVDRAREELDQNARPALSSTVPNMADYDVIILGYPIWWHTEPMAITGWKLFCLSPMASDAKGSDAPMNSPFRLCRGKGNVQRSTGPMEVPFSQMHRIGRPFAHQNSMILSCWR